MKPPTPLSPGRPAPPRNATPASVLNAHKLVGVATRVVMLKHRDNAPSPAVSFGGKSVSAVAMLVGGGLELQLPLYSIGTGCAGRSIIQQPPLGRRPSPLPQLQPQPPRANLQTVPSGACVQHLLARIVGCYVAHQRARPPCARQHVATVGDETGAVAGAGAEDEAALR